MMMMVIMMMTMMMVDKYDFKQKYSGNNLPCCEGGVFDFWPRGDCIGDGDGDGATQHAPNKPLSIEIIFFSMLQEQVKQIIIAE